MKKTTYNKTETVCHARIAYPENKQNFHSILAIRSGKMIEPREKKYGRTGSV